jgi:hypothetical protein
VAKSCAEPGYVDLYMLVVRDVCATDGSRDVLDGFVEGFVRRWRVDPKPDTDEAHLAERKKLYGTNITCVAILRMRLVERTSLQSYIDRIAYPLLEEDDGRAVDIALQFLMDAIVAKERGAVRLPRGDLQRWCAASVPMKMRFKAQRIFGSRYFVLTA